MPTESVWIGAVSLGVFLLTLLLAGRFTVSHGISSRFRRTALLGIRVRSGSGLTGRPVLRRVTPGTPNRSYWLPR